jgi:hypothetical protein
MFRPDEAQQRRLIANFRASALSGGRILANDIEFRSSAKLRNRSEINT